MCFFCIEDEKEVELSKLVSVLRAAIENHRSKTKHEMCWENDEELWAVLDDGVKIDHTPPPKDEFLRRCAEYCSSRMKGA